MEIPKENAKQPIDNQEIFFPEFEDYEIFDGKTKVEPKEGVFMSAFKYVGSGLGSLGSYIGQYNIGSKIKSGGSATLKGLSIAGQKLYDLSKPVVDYTANKADYLYKKVSGGNTEEDKEESQATTTGKIIEIDNKDEDEDEAEIIIQKTEEDENENENKYNINEETNDIKTPSNYKKI